MKGRNPAESMVGRAPVGQMRESRRTESANTNMTCTCLQSKRTVMLGVGRRKKVKEQETQKYQLAWGTRRRCDSSRVGRQVHGSPYPHGGNDNLFSSTWTKSWHSRGAWQGGKEEEGEREGIYRSPLPCGPHPAHKYRQPRC